MLTNAKNHRMDPVVPLVIAEVNPDHLDVLADQRRVRGWSGAIVANGNCASDRGGAADGAHSCKTFGIEHKSY